jgi:hypothetical protein
MLEKHNLPEDNSTNKPNIESFIIYKGLPDTAVGQILIYLSPAEVIKLEQVSRGHRQQLNKFLLGYFYSECQRNAAFGLLQYLWKSPSEKLFDRYMSSCYGTESSLGGLSVASLFPGQNDIQLAINIQKRLRNLILAIKGVHENYPESRLGIFSTRRRDFKKVNIVKPNAFYKQLLAIMKQSILVEHEFNEALLRKTVSINEWLHDLQLLELQPQNSLLTNINFVKRVPSKTILKFAKLYGRFASLIFCDKNFSAYLRKISIDQIFNIYLCRSIFDTSETNLNTILSSIQKETIICEKLSPSDIMSLSFTSPGNADIILNSSKLTKKLMPEQIEKINHYRKDPSHFNVTSFKKHLKQLFEIITCNWNGYFRTSDNMTFEEKLTNLFKIKEDCRLVILHNDVKYYLDLLNSFCDSTFFPCYALLFEILKKLIDLDKTIDDNILILFIDEITQTELQAIKLSKQVDFSETYLNKISQLQIKINQFREAASSLEHCEQLQRIVNNEITTLQVSVNNIKINMKSNTVEYINDRIEIELQAIERLEQADFSKATLSVIASSVPTLDNQIQNLNKYISDINIQINEVKINTLTEKLKNLRAAIYQQTAQKWQQFKIEHYARIALAVVSAVLPITLFWTIPWIKRKQHQSFVYVELPENDWDTMKMLRRLKPDNETIARPNSNQTSQLFNNQGEFKKYIVTENGKAKIFMNSEQAVRFDILRAAAKKYSSRTITQKQKIEIQSKLGKSKQRSRNEIQQYKTEFRINP